MKKDIYKNFLVLIFFLITLPVVIYALSKVAEIRKEAAGIPANIIVDTSISLGEMNNFWQGLAQGGERNTYLTDSQTKRVVKNLQTKYIRLDHLYGSLDGINVVTGINNGVLSYNWTSLDKRVDAILAMGALPFLSLSYMPSMISLGNETSAPKDYRLWQTLVRDTIEHFSGAGGRNLENVYYEVWNEPDLFGEWKFDRGETGKSYLLLYKYAANGAQSARGTKKFFFGGPATTEPKEKLIKNFLAYVSNNNLRLDFLSWHRYHKKVSQFVTDLDNVDTWVENTPKIISEWGSDPGVSSWHDGFIDGVHYLAVTRQLIDRTSQNFFFEIKDSVKDDGAEIPGKWGITSFYGRIKPKYYAMALLPRLFNERIALSGEGSFVTGFATRDAGGKIGLLLSNYDSSYSHAENVPVLIRGLNNGSYSFSRTSLSADSPAGSETTTNILVVNGELVTNLTMLPNTAVLVTLSPIGGNIDFDTGRFGYSGDKSFLINNSSKELSFPLGNFDINKGSVEYWIKFNPEKNNQEKTALFEIPLTGNKYFGAYMTNGQSAESIDFGLFDSGTVSVNNLKLNNDEWYHFLFSWENNDSLKIYLSGKELARGDFSENMGIGSTMYIGQRQNGMNKISGVIDELRISKNSRSMFGFSLFESPYNLDTDTFILRHFDNTLD